jgi:hypothetical protein
MQNKATKKSSTLYCFTPLVSLATFAIEFGLAFYTFAKHRKTLFGKLATITLILLGIFQLAEYSICKTGYAASWTIIGYLAITFLPALGLHMTSLMTKKSTWTPIGYLVAGITDLIIIFTPNIFSSSSCPGNFVIFNPLLPVFKIFYSIYYYVFILIALLMLIKAVSEGDKNKKSAEWMLAGYLSFLLPTFVIYIYEKAARVAVPSIMCGFALLFSIILVLKIIPEFEKLIKEN